MMMILIYNIALLYHRQAALATYHNSDNDYIIAIESYHQALQILEDKILSNKDRNMMNDIHHYEGSCKATFLLMKAAILNNLIHLYRIFYQTDEARQVVNILENHLILCNHHSSDDLLYNDHCCNYFPYISFQMRLR